MSIFSKLLKEYIEVFMGDFMVYDTPFDACLESLSRVLDRCTKTNIVLNFEKCHFMVTKGIVLGHLVSNRGIEVDKAKIDIISSLSHPIFMQEVCSFLGHASFCRRFIKNFNTIALPLSKLLQQDVEFRLTTIPILQPPNWELPFEFMCDASNLALRGSFRSMTYAFCTLDSSQDNYTTTEKELLAIVFALDKFRSYLLGSKIVVFSNHATLKFLLKKPDTKPRLIRWMLLLQEFDIEISDKSGAKNLLANHLSRIKGSIDPLPIRDDFLDEQLMQLDGIVPWFADIVNYILLHIFYLQRHPNHVRIKLRVMLNIMCRIIHICGSFVVISFVILHLYIGIKDHIGQPGRYWIVGFIGLPFSRMPTTLLPLVSNAKE
ncbi:Retrovirus-related Pol polyprotein from transposon 17.6, partial [Mucuna pruriens]